MKYTTTISLLLACGLSPIAFAADSHSMTGCLAKGADAGTYTLTNVDGSDTPVAIPQSTVDLAMHVGHKVEITGTTIEGAEPHAMQVSAMKHLAATCP